MGFNTPSGPPASRRQIEELLALVERAGHRDFRDARGPLGLSQRQAGGKFTRDEATAFIDQLEQAEYDGGIEAVAAPPPLTATDRKLAAFRDEQLAAELQRRGWVVIEP